MPTKLTNKTNFVVKETGRPVFELDGENVSEKSATIKVDDFYVNLPSIHGNMKYNEDELYNMLMNNKIKATSVHKKHSDAIKAAKERSKNLTIIERNDKNKGGMMEQQMSLFEEGGMKDDGLDRDPVSGNEIPPGSLAKEVRDDIPAQLSDGEYVVPADVVQYFGVKFFEDLRAEAKRGLAEMEATGRIGGEPVEVDMTMIAFGKADDKKKKKKAEGGMIGYSNGGMSEDQKKIQASQPSFNPIDYVTLGFTPVSPIAQTGQLQQNNITKTVTYYHGETGESRVVTFVNGIVTPPEDVQYTQPPWSTIKPSPTQKQTQQSEDKERKDPPPGWGADPQQYNFTGWDQERWDQEIDTLIRPSGIGNLGVVGGFFKTAGAANALTAIKLMEAKGFDTKLAQGKVDELISSFNSAQKSVVNILTGDKLMGDYPSYVSKSNPTYANMKSSSTTPKVSISTKEEKDDGEARYEKDTGATSIPGITQDSIINDSGTTVKEYDKRQKTKGTGGPPSKSGKNKPDFEDPNTGAGMINKGGLISKPKRRNKK